MAYCKRFIFATSWKQENAESTQSYVDKDPVTEIMHFCYLKQSTDDALEFCEA